MNKQKRVAKKETLAERLTRLREAKGLTRIDLAVAAGVSSGALQLIERGVTQKPRPAILDKIAVALEVEPSYLLTGEASA